jgi:hypothetical protein
MSTNRIEFTVTKRFVIEAPEDEIRAAFDNYCLFEDEDEDQTLSLDQILGELAIVTEGGNATDYVVEQSRSVSIESLLEHYRGYTITAVGGGPYIIWSATDEHIDTCTSLSHAKATIDRWMNAP